MVKKTNMFTGLFARSQDHYAYTISSYSHISIHVRGPYSTNKAVYCPYEWKYGISRHSLYSRIYTYSRLFSMFVCQRWVDSCLGFEKQKTGSPEGVHHFAYYPNSNVMS